MMMSGGSGRRELVFQGGDEWREWLRDMPMMGLGLGLIKRLVVLNVS